MMIQIAAAIGYRSRVVISTNSLDFTSIVKLRKNIYLRELHSRKQWTGVSPSLPHDLQVTESHVFSFIYFMKIMKDKPYSRLKFRHIPFEFLEIVLEDDVFKIQARRERFDIWFSSAISCFWESNNCVRHETLSGPASIPIDWFVRTIVCFFGIVQLSQPRFSRSTLHLLSL